MTRDQKFLIVTGAILIGLLIAIAAFSLGVYIGMVGWPADAPRVAGPVNAVPRVVEPPGNPVDAPGAVPAVPGALPAPPADTSAGARPQLVGRVRSLSGGTLTVDTPQGLRVARLAPDADIVSAVEGTGELPATVDDVVPGKHVALFGRFGADGSRQLTVLRLILLPPNGQR